MHGQYNIKFKKQCDIATEAYNLSRFKAKHNFFLTAIESTLCWKFFHLWWTDGALLARKENLALQTGEIAYSSGRAV